MENQKFTISYLGYSGPMWLCAVESHCHGDRFQGYFAPQRSRAMPLTLYLAEELCKHFLADMLHVNLQVVPYPLPDQEVAER